MTAPVLSIADRCEDMTGEVCEVEEGAIRLPDDGEEGLDLGDAVALVYLDHDGVERTHRFTSHDVVVWGFTDTLLLQGGGLTVDDDGIEG